MLNGIITPLSADPLLTFCASLFGFSKCFSFQMANYRAGEESKLNKSGSAPRFWVGWGGGCWVVVGLRAIIRRSNITRFDVE